ncbi:MAG: hypothetical protein ACP5UG_05425 [Thermoplasmata archaeon]
MKYKNKYIIMKYSDEYEDLIIKNIFNLSDSNFSYINYKRLLEKKTYPIEKKSKDYSELRFKFIIMMKLLT